MARRYQLRCDTATSPDRLVFLERRGPAFTVVQTTALPLSVARRLFSCPDLRTCETHFLALSPLAAATLIPVTAERLSAEEERRRGSDETTWLLGQALAEGATLTLHPSPAISKERRWRATRCAPAHAGVVTTETELRFLPASESIVQHATGAGREDGDHLHAEESRQEEPVATVAGLDEALAALCGMLALPFTRARALAHLQVECPRGLLLHGPPGCGKTLLVRAAAAKTSARLISVRFMAVAHDSRQGCGILQAHFWSNPPPPHTPLSSAPCHFSTGQRARCGGAVFWRERGKAARALSRGEKRRRGRALCLVPGRARRAVPQAGGRQ